MDLIAQARKDFQTYAKGEFSFPLILSNSDESQSIEIRGLASSHFLSVDAQGIPINAKNVHVSIIEQDVIAKGYITRNSAGEVNMVGHHITFKNNLGVDEHYIINETYPSETLGVIVCILGDYEFN